MSYMESLVAQRLKRLPGMRETQVQSLGWEDPLEKENGNPLQYSCLDVIYICIYKSLCKDDLLQNIFSIKER